MKDLEEMNKFDTEFEQQLSVVKTAIENLHIEPLETDNKSVSAYKHQKSARLVKAKELFFKCLNGSLKTKKAE